MTSAQIFTIWLKRGLLDKQDVVAHCWMNLVCTPSHGCSHCCGYTCSSHHVHYQVELTPSARCPIALCLISLFHSGTWFPRLQQLHHPFWPCLRRTPPQGSPKRSAVPWTSLPPSASPHPPHTWTCNRRSRCKVLISSPNTLDRRFEFEVWDHLKGNKEFTKWSVNFSRHKLSSWGMYREWFKFYGPLCLIHL